MGDILIPSNIPIIHQPFMSNQWFTEESWVKNFNIKYEASGLGQRHKEFKDSPTNTIAFFYTTPLDIKRDHNDSAKFSIENNLMMALAKVRMPEGRYLGKIIEITELHRFGIYDVRSWKDVQQKLPDDDTIKIFTAYEAPVVWLGDVGNYKTLLDKIKKWMDNLSRTSEV